MKDKHCSWMMTARMQAHDGDGNGTLSIEEFEALHSGLIRETMVDRFQRLDANGDGEVTQGEVSSSAMNMATPQFGKMHGQTSKMPKN